MRGFAGFLKRERLYILILILVTIVSILVVLGPPDRTKHEGHSAVKDASASLEERSLNDRPAVEKALAGNKYLALMFMIVSLLTAVIFILGIVIDLSILWLRRAGKPLEMATRTHDKISWTLWDVTKVVALYLFFAYIILIAEASLGNIFPAIKGNNFRMIFNSSIMDILVVVFILYFTVSQYKVSFESLGLTTKNFFRNIYYGIVAYIAFMPLMVAIVAVTAIIINLTKFVPHVQPVVGLFLEEKNMQLLMYTSIFAAIAGPVIEELFFRGFMYNAMKKYAGVFWAMTITASLFAGLHAHMVGFMPILALGILLAYLYEKTGSLVSSVTVHVIHNVSMVTLVFLVKQLGVYK